MMIRQNMWKARKYIFDRVVIEWYLPFVSLLIARTKIGDTPIHLVQLGFLEDEERVRLLWLGLSENVFGLARILKKLESRSVVLGEYLS
jgi:hypothetical protein